MWAATFDLGGFSKYLLKFLHAYVHVGLDRQKAGCPVRGLGPQQRSGTGGGLQRTAHSKRAPAETGPQLPAFASYGPVKN